MPYGTCVVLTQGPGSSSPEVPGAAPRLSVGPPRHSLERTALEPPPSRWQSLDGAGTGRSAGRS